MLGVVIVVLLQIAAGLVSALLSISRLTLTVDRPQVLRRQSNGPLDTLQAVLCPAVSDM